MSDINISNLACYDRPRIVNTVGLSNGCTGHVIKLSSPKIRVFPNPLTSEGYLRLSSLPICSLNIEIFNRQGEIIKKYKGEGGQNFHLTRDNIPSGLYLYKITTDDQKIYTGKFIIQ